MKKSKNWYATWKISPTTGERLYSSTEIGNTFGISARLLNKVLIKLGILVITNTGQYMLIDNTLGEQCFYNINHHYDSNPSTNTTNLTLKFTEKGKNYIENLLINKLNLLKEHVDYNLVETDFPEGKFALSIRKAGTKYNPNIKSCDMIYLSYRTSRNDSEFSKNYLFISDDDATKIRNKINEYGKTYHYNTKNYKMPLDTSQIAFDIIKWKNTYFQDILKKSGKITKITSIDKENNKKLIQDYLKL